MQSDEPTSVLGGTRNHAYPRTANLATWASMNACIPQQSSVAASPTLTGCVGHCTFFEASTVTLVIQGAGQYRVNLNLFITNAPATLARCGGSTFHDSHPSSSQLFSSQFGRLNCVSKTVNNAENPPCFRNPVSCHENTLRSSHGENPYHFTRRLP